MNAVQFLGLKKYRLTCNVPGVTEDTGIEVLAKTPKQAWQKFCRQRFGELKPDPLDWKVEEIHDCQ